jgi:hypothetical protein
LEAAGDNAVTELLFELGPQRLAGIDDDVQIHGWAGSFGDPDARDGSAGSGKHPPPAERGFPRA